MLLLMFGVVVDVVGGVEVGFACVVGVDDVDVALCGDVVDRVDDVDVVLVGGDVVAFDLHDDVYVDVVGLDVDDE